MKSRYRFMIEALGLGIAAYVGITSLLSKKPETPADTARIAQYILQNSDNKKEEENIITYTKFRMNMAFPQQEDKPVPKHFAKVILTDKEPFAKNPTDFGEKDTLSFEVFKQIYGIDKEYRQTSLSALVLKSDDIGVNGFGELGDRVSLKSDGNYGNFINNKDITHFGKDTWFYSLFNKEGRIIYTNAAHAIVKGLEAGK